MTLEKIKRFHELGEIEYRSEYTRLLAVFASDVENTENLRYDLE